MKKLFLLLFVVLAPSSTLAALGPLTDEQCNAIEGTMWQVTSDLKEAAEYFVVGHNNDGKVLVLEDALRSLKRNGFVLNDSDTSKLSFLFIFSISGDKYRYSFDLSQSDQSAIYGTLSVKQADQAYWQDYSAVFSRVYPQRDAEPEPEPEPEDPPAKTQAEALLGYWVFEYFIGSSYSNSQDYNLTYVTESTSTPGEYDVYGVDEYGDAVIAGYSSLLETYSLLDTGIIIDRFYTFDFSSTDEVSGCYYQIYLSTGDWSSCYSMNGDRLSTSLNITINPRSNPVDLQAVEYNFTPDQDLLNRYNELRNTTE